MVYDALLIHPTLANGYSIMNQSQIIYIQERIGTTGDGFWGPVSIATCQKYLRDMMPKPFRFPVEGSEEFEKFYGTHGEKDGYTPPHKTIELPFTIYYQGEKKVNKLNVHEKCADSLLRVFERLAVTFPDIASREAAGILVYDGLYNPRLMRGSETKWSKHAWMTAIDINAAQNARKTRWPEKATMPIEVMECFAREGWLSGGAFWGYDAMHFQATSPKQPHLLTAETKISLENKDD